MMHMRWLRRPESRWSPASRLVLLVLAASKATALSQGYCSNLNTGTKQASDDFMTNGKCHDLCSGSAFAIVQYKDCYCSDYAPGISTSTGSCNVACPGYPFEQCGDQSSGLYGYIALGPSPKGTQGGSSSSNSPSQTQDPTSSEQTDTPSPTSAAVQDTVTETPSVSISTISLTPSTISTTSVSTTQQIVPKPITLDPQTSSTTPTTSSTSTSSSRSPSSSTWTPTPVISVMTVTGQLKTLTVTPTAPPTATETLVSAAQSSQTPNGGFFSNPGKVAGTFVAIAIIIAAIIAGLVFFFWRRRKQDQGKEQLPSTAGSGTPQRRPSRLSQMGLLGGDSNREKPEHPTITTTGWGPGNGADKSPADTLDARSSYPRVVDQRLEPMAVWNPLHDNGSHVSVRSFRDDQDYSRRMLRIANPDE